MPFMVRPYRRFPMQCFRIVCLHVIPGHSAWRATERGEELKWTVCALNGFRHSVAPRCEDSVHHPALTGVFSFQLR